MRRTRRTAKLISPPKESDSENEPLKKKKIVQDEDSSSESDLEIYLKPADQIDLNSSFFAPQVKQNTGFDAIEKDIFSGIQQLSNSDSDEETVGEQSENIPTGEAQKHHFETLSTYNKKLEDVKKHIEEYNAKKKMLQENNLNIESLLAKGEASGSQTTVEDMYSSLHSSDFESLSESEKEDWEEVKTKEEKVIIPKDGVEIKVQMPDAIRKKKSFDLMAAIKRRMNRVKKETQVFVHKVHLLCWIAHGNYVNRVLNSRILLGLALSLLPSQHCYPPSRLDLTYLQQVLTWYGKAMSIESDAKTSQTQQALEDSLQAQISKKEAQDYKMFVYIFVCVLRSLGVSARLVLSLQVEPLRPPISELCPLSNKKPTDKIDSKVQKNLNTSKKNTKNLTPSKKDSKNSSKAQISDVSKKKEKTQKKNVSPQENKENSVKMMSHQKPKNIADFSYEEKKTVNKLKADANEKKTSNETKANSKSKAGGKQEGKQNTRGLKNLKTIKVEKETKLNKPSAAKLRSEKSTKTDEETKIKKEITSLHPKQDLKPLRRSTRLSVKSPTELDDTEKEAQDEVFVESDVDSKHEGKKSHKQNFFKVKVNLKKIKNSDARHSKKDVKTECNSPDEKLLAKVQVKCEDDIGIKVPQVDGANDTSDSDKPSSVSRKKKLNFSKLKSKSENNQTAKQLRSVSITPSKKNSKVSPEVKEEKQSSKVKKLSLKKLRTPLDVKLANLRDLARSSQSSSDSDKSRFFGSSPPKKQLDVKNDIVNLVTQSIVQQKELARSKLVKHKRTSKKLSDNDDSDYLPETTKKKCKEKDDFKEKAVKVKRRIPMKKDLAEVERVKKEQKEEEKKKKGVNVWVEVFAEAEEKWISVDVTKGKLHCVSELYARATNPVCYILAWDNDNYVKDVTKRYCTQWNTVTRKLRVDPGWWNTSLKSLMGPRTTRSKEEDDELAREQLEKPLPTTISEYKDHPLYVLKRHLLKFQAIYPPDAATLGFIRNEPVYSRDCVYVLHSRELWLKEAKVVKAGEQPYKIVKARPKYDKLSNSIITDRPLEIFGIWQVEDYVPPSAENGVVPRNAYGNVELFKPCMLPKGTVHLQLPGLNKVARKMNIDCAPAVTGFDFHAGWNHAIYDGFIVCEEHADKLVAAWYMEQEEAEKRAQEKIEKRVYDNWKRLIRGLLIRERLKARYNFGGPATQSKDQPKKGAKSKSAKSCIKKRRIKSDSEDD